MDEWFIILYWSGPIGVGFFLAGVGVLFWGISRMSSIPQKAKKSKEEK